MTVYSPTQTTVWDRCPLKRAIQYQEGWEPRAIQQRDIASILGSAFADGMQVYHTSPGGLVNTILGVGQDSVVRRKKVMIEDQNRTITPALQTQWDTLEKTVVDTLRRYIQDDPIPKQWEKVGSEVDLGADYGHCRLDLVLRDPHDIAILDYKVKKYLKKEWEGREFQRWKDSWQLRHYLWAASHYYNTPVTRYYICAVIISPTFRVQLHQFNINPETLSMWEVSAKRKWEDMTQEDAGVRVSPQAVDHADSFGLCEYYNACFVYRFDEHRMNQDYVRSVRH